jgi:DHA1 family tetracycline resistance protein-like MFS transporter
MVYISCVSLFANVKLGLDAQQTGTLLMAAGAVRVFVRFVIFVPLLRRLGDRRTSFLGLGIFVVAYLLLGFVQTPLQFAAVLCTVSFAAACTRGVLTSFLSRSVKPWEQGQAMGLSSSLDSMAQIFGPAAGGYILGAFPVWTYGGLASLFALGAFLLAFRRLEFQFEEPDPPAEAEHQAIDARIG